MSTTRIAIAQTGTRLFDAAATWAVFEARLREAAKGGAQIVVFPEAFFGGYPKGLDFGATLGVRTPEGRKLFQRYSDEALLVPGPVTEAIGALARECGIMVVTGAVERQGGTLYCAALVFDARGALVHHHRKILPTAIERIIWGQGDGASLTTVETPHGKLGALICWENYMPLARMALYQAGVELYCMPTVDDRDLWLPTIRHIAREGRCFVISACQYLPRANYPEDVLKSARYLPELPIRGGSCVVGPLGEFVLEPQYDREGVFFADLDRNEIAQGKYDLDVAGHYARPDLFDFRVRPLS